MTGSKPPLNAPNDAPSPSEERSPWDSPPGTVESRRPRVVGGARLAEPRAQPDLVGKQRMQGQHPGDRYVRVVRQQSEDFERAGPGHLVATEEALEARGTVGRAFGKFKRDRHRRAADDGSAAHERLTKVKALAVLSSDALSSVAYATEEILRVLLLGRVGALSMSASRSASAIVALLFIVGISYRQTIKAYPTRRRLLHRRQGQPRRIPALTAGAALLFGYILTVAVSIAAGVAALISAVPELHDHRVASIWHSSCLLVTVLNLRGIRESGSIFAVPTYLFLVGIFVMLGHRLRPQRDGRLRAVRCPPAKRTRWRGRAH